MTSPLAAIEAKLRNGDPITYEDAADIFQYTMVGSATMQHNGLNREDVLRIVRERFPDPEQLAVSLRGMLAMFDAMNKGGMH